MHALPHIHGTARGATVHLVSRLGATRMTDSLSCNSRVQPISSELRDFLMQLLDKDVLKRLDVVAAMRHPWITLSGAAPLVSLREQQFAASVAMEVATGPNGIPKAPLSRLPSGVGVVSISQEDMDAAIRQIDGSTAQCVDQVFVEAQYCDG